MLTMKQKHLLSILFCLLFLSFSQESSAQATEDTVIVQTLTFDSITTRRSEWLFPSANESYRKVLMLYTLKCDPATTQDGFDCGEWDYLTYTFLYDDTGELDSNKIETGHYYIEECKINKVSFYATIL